MDDLVQILEEEKIQCPACGKSAYFRSFILKDTKPHKVVIVKDCAECGLTETTEDDYQTLDYGVRISCDFTENDDSSKDLRRMAFINNRAEATFYTNDPDGTPREIFSFSAERSNIDCIEGLMMRGDEALSIGCNAEESGDLKDRRNSFGEIMKGKGFRLVIVDDSGYSRVCPVGIEYTDAQNLSLEELSRMDTQVLHEKIPKNKNQ